MKNTYMIVENNYYKFLTAKYVVEGQLRLPLTMHEAASSEDLAQLVAETNPDVIISCPAGGILEVVDRLKALNANARNCRVILVGADFDELAQAA